MIEALDVIDRMIEAEAVAANRAAVAAGTDFDRLSMGMGVGIRLKAFQDVRDAIVRAGIDLYR